MTATDLATDTVVVARGIRKKFGDNVVLDGLDVNIRAGEFVALLGRSGSGKSTFLRALGGLDAEFDGELRVPERQAVVFQEPRLLPWQRVLTNVTVGLPATGAVREQARVALGEVNLADKAKVWPRTLSGGEAQRVALARAWTTATSRWLKSTTAVAVRSSPSRPRRTVANRTPRFWSLAGSMRTPGAAPASSA